MAIESKQFARTKKRTVAATTLVLLLTSGGAARLHAQNAPATTNAEKKTMTTASKFYCNTKALTPAERSSQAIDRQTDRVAEGDRRDRERLRIPVQSVYGLSS